MKIVERYYKTQTYIDIGWREFGWFNSSLIELMAITYILEKLGIVVSGSTLYWVLVAAFIFFFLFGLFLKRTGIYDKSQYVDAEIDPVTKEILEAARIICQKQKSKV